MQVKIDRDSVCAGDDVDSHDELRRYEPQMYIGAVINYIVASGFLPSMQGDKVSWVVLIDDKPIGVIAPKWPSPKLAIDPRSELQKHCALSPSTIFFRYETQKDPQLVYDETFGGQK